MPLRGLSGESIWNVGEDAGDAGRPCSVPCEEIGLARPAGVIGEPKYSPRESMSWGVRSGDEAREELSLGAKPEESELDERSECRLRSDWSCWWAICWDGRWVEVESVGSVDASATVTETDLLQALLLLLLARQFPLVLLMPTILGDALVVAVL